jgi:hypothetical protein
MDDRASRVRVTGPLAPHAERFRARLAERGYVPGSAPALFPLWAHLSRWLRPAGRAAGHLAPTLLDRFLAARKAAGHRRLPSARGRAAGGLPDHGRADGPGTIAGG